MNGIKKRSFYIFIILSFSFLLSACSSNKELEGGISEENKINLQQGASILDLKGSYEVLNFSNDKYVPLDTKDVITNYNDLSGNYVFVKDGIHYINYKGKETKIEDNNYNYMKLSEDGEYLSYMTYDTGYTLKVISLEDSKSIKLNSKVAISGNLYDWLDKDTLVYYGISDENVNGVFTYNLKNNKEELLYKLDGGYVEFLKSDSKNIIILQQTVDDKTILKSINKEDKSINVVSKDFKDVNDIVLKDNVYYVLGTKVNDNPSLYKIQNSKGERVAFSFPKSILLEKGLSVTKEGNILFIGSNTTEKEQEIFSYKDGDISIISDKTGEYNFIDVN